MSLFKDLLKPILKLFDNGAFPDLDADEKESISVKDSTFLRL